MAAQPDTPTPTSAAPHPTVAFSTPQPREILVQVMLGEGEVSRLVVHDLAMQIDRAIVRMGGIGGVQTLPNVRKRGYARQMLAAAVEHMDQQGFDVSVLFGIHDFYHRYGFITSLIESRLTMPTRFAERVGEALAARPNSAQPVRTVRPYQPDRDELAVVELYHAKNADRTGFLARHPGEWWGFRLGSTWGRQTDVHVLVEGDGLFEKVVGYLALDRSDEEVTVSEIEATDPEGLDWLIGYVGQLAVGRRVGQITWFIHPDSEAAHRLQYYGCEMTLSYAFDRGSMARVIHLERTLRKLLPVLDQRLARSAATQRPLDLELAIWDANDPRPDLATNPFAARKAGDGTSAPLPPCRPQAVRLHRAQTGQPLQLEAVASPGANAASLPQELFTQLLFGYRPALEVLAAPAAHVTPGQVELLAALFPPAAPYVPRNDRF